MRAPRQRIPLRSFILYSLVLVVGGAGCARQRAATAVQWPNVAPTT
ncbi:MAG: hypothetical protein GY778_11525 [bacterium]|nr:hypothetical protein [bacterium]